MYEKREYIYIYIKPLSFGGHAEVNLMTYAKEKSSFTFDYLFQQGIVAEQEPLA